MLYTYLQAAFRNLRRHALYSLVNIAGLAIGIAVTMTILLYVLHEHSYDRWQANASRIFSVFATYNVDHEPVSINRMSYALGPAARQQDGRVTGYLRAFTPFNKPLLQRKDQPGTWLSVETPVLFADSNFFGFFSYRLLQ